MSIGMLGETPAMVEEKEIDKLTKENEDNPKKLMKSASIKNFFQTQTPHGESRQDKNLISSFFKSNETPSENDKMKEMIHDANVCVVSESSSIINRICKDEDPQEADVALLKVELVGDDSKTLKSASIHIQEDVCVSPVHIKNKDKSPERSTKRSKPKWSLSWRVSKSSKLGTCEDSDSDFEGDLTVNSENQKTEVSKKPKSDKSMSKVAREAKKSQTEKPRGTNAKNSKKDQASFSKTEELSSSEEMTSIKLSPEVCDVEMKDLGNQGAKTFSCSIEGLSTCENNAFDILMNRPRKHSSEKEQSVKSDIPENMDDGPSHSIEEATVTKIDVPSSLSSSLEVVDCDNDLTQIKSLHKSPSCDTNAFDLMMKKHCKIEGGRSSENAELDLTLGDATTGSTKRKCHTFKLSICYSKRKSPVEFLGDEGDASLIAPGNLIKNKKEQNEEQELPSSKKETKKNVAKSKAEQIGCKAGSVVEENIASKKKRKNLKCKLDMGDTPSSFNSNDSLKEGKTSLLKKKKGMKSNSDSPINHDLDSKERKEKNDSKVKQTKIKDKGSETKARKHTGEKAAKESVYVSESSNSSVENISDKEIVKKKSSRKNSKQKEDGSLSVKQKKSGRHHGSCIRSSDSDDFEKKPGQIGLRKRVKVQDYAGAEKTANKEICCKAEEVTEVVEVVQKATKKKKSKRKEVVVLTSPEPTSPDIEMVMSCKPTQKTNNKEKPTTAPQKLAPIFKKQKPQATQKKEDKVLETTAGTFCKSVSKDCSSPMKDKKVTQASKTIEMIDLEAANKKFNALFAGSRTAKSQILSTPVIQLSAPWPTFSHVLQRGECDQSEERFWNFTEPEIRNFTKTPEKLQGNLVLPSQRLKLGDLTDCHQEERSRENKDSIFPSEPFTNPVIKKILAEMANHYPGIPVKRLYKRYKAREDEQKPENSSTTQVTQAQKEEENTEGSFSNIEGNFKKAEGARKRGRAKRKLSSESENETAGNQQKKVQKNVEKQKEVSREGIKSLEGEKSESEISGRLRKKRGREDEVSGDRNMRRSTRLKKHTQTEKESEGPEQETQESVISEKMSKRKKRRTMEDTIDDSATHKHVPQNEPKGCALLAASEDSRTSHDDGKKADNKRDLQWTDRYKPLCSSEVMGNTSSVGRLRSWLEEWKIKREKTLRKELEMQKRLLAKQKNQGKAKTSSQSLEWWKEDSDSDFNISDAESDESDSEGSGLCNAMLVTGPKGAGKTATVYACARELGYKIFEVNCTCKRSSRQILSQLEEATQSHLVITNPSANTPHSSAFGGLFSSLGEKPASLNPMSVFFKPKSKDSQDEPAEKLSSKSKPSKGEKTEREKTKEGKGRSLDCVDTLGAESGSNTALAIKAASLILFEEVDVIFEDDKSFWSAVNSFMRNTKCPIIMTSNDSHVECDGHYEQLTLKTPSINLLSAHLQLTALINNVFVNPADLKTLVSMYGCDIRQSFLALQFWLQSGGGERLKYEDYCAIENAKTNDQLATKITSEREVVAANRDSQDQCPSSSSQEVTASGDTAMDVIENAGDESIFLSLEDWKTISTLQTRSRSRAGTNALDVENSDSDFESSKKTITVGEDTNTDSIFEANDTSDSQSIQVSREGEELGVIMPEVHCRLVESTLGMLNCITSRDKVCITLLRDVAECDDGVQGAVYKDISSLIQFCQYLSMSIVSSNISLLLPELFVQSDNETEKADKEKPKESERLDRKTVEDKLQVRDSVFSDRSLFDDGICSADDEASLQGKTSEGTGTQSSISRSQASDDNPEQNTSGAATESKDSFEDSKRFNANALEIFSNLVEDRSFMDACTQRLPRDATQSWSAGYGWWHAHPRPGLGDEVITIRDQSDWLTEDRRASIRGALEVASLECSYSRYKAVQKQGPSDGGCLSNELHLNLNELTTAQRSTLSGRNKLYKTTCSSLPTLTYCSHRVVCTDYLPTLRAICHAEKLRETANTKRRFLHYLNSNSLPLNHPTIQSLADSYLAQ